MKPLINKQLVRLLRQCVNLTYVRRLIFFAYRLSNREDTRAQQKTMLDNYGHAIRGVEKALQRHEALLNDLQNQLQQGVAHEPPLEKQIDGLNNEVLPGNRSTLPPARLTPNVPINVSLIINTYNRLHTLPNTLNSLNYLRYPHLEVIVVDGPSTDGTRQYLQAVWASKVKIYTCDVANLAKSRNIGLKQAAGDIVCFIDDDAVPEADWIEELVSAYQNKKVAAVGGWTRNRTGVAVQFAHLSCNRSSVSESDRSDPLKTQTYKPHAEKFPTIGGGNASFRRSALLEISGFDEEYAYYAEDADLVLRLLDTGYELRTVSTAEVHHYTASSHIRSQTGNICSWSKTMTSIAYFCIKNAAPATSFWHCLEQIEEQKYILRRNTRYRLAVNRIDHANFERLMAEIDQSSRQGITDAFAFPCRQLIKNHIHQPSPWKAFPRLLTAPSRLRLAFIVDADAPSTEKGDTLSLRHLAQALADAGHEITVITQTETSHQHTVSFETNLWVHRLPNNSPMAATFPPGMPTGIPDAFRQTAGRILAELDRVNQRRQIHYVIGTNWNLSLAAVIASRQYPVVLHLCLQDTLAWQEKTLDYRRYAAQITDARAQALQQATHILACSQTVCRDAALNLNLCLDEQRITLFPLNTASSAVQTLESILTDLRTTQGKLHSEQSDALQRDEKTKHCVYKEMKITS